VSKPVDQAAADEAGQAQPTVGAQLRTARDARGGDLEAASRSLRIEVAMIAALEADDFAALSAPVFTKGYLKRYAVYLGLDADGILDRYHEQVGDEQQPVVSGSSPIKLRDERQVALWIVAAALLVIVAVAAFWWISGDNDQPAESPMQLEPLSDPERAVPLSDPEPAVPLSDPEPAAPADDPEPFPNAPGAAEAALDPDSPGVGASEPESSVVQAESGPAPLQAQGDLQIELVFTEDCWAEVTDARGNRLFYGLGQAGARSRFSAVPPVSFLIGNVNGVTVTVDGADYTAPPESRRGNLARFVLSAAGA
jgi:cytoskeleton protein RodZ